MNTPPCPNCRSESTQNILESIARGVTVLMIFAIVLGILYWPFALIFFSGAIISILYGLKKGRRAFYCRDCRCIWQADKNV
jgi:hypothetical protein